MVVCTNGDMCIAGQVLTGVYLITVLEAEINFRFSYDRISSTHIFRPLSIAAFLKDNIIMVTKQTDKKDKRYFIFDKSFQTRRLNLYRYNRRK